MDKQKELLAKGSESYEAILEHIVSEFEFYGKTISQWDEELVLSMEKDELTPKEIRVHFIELNNKIQLIDHFCGLSELAYKTASSSTKASKADNVKRLVAQYEAGGKRPSATIIDKLADNLGDDSYAARQVALMIRDYWAQKRVLFSELRKIAESVAITVHSELKYLEQE